MIQCRLNSIGIVSVMKKSAAPPYHARRANAPAASAGSRRTTHPNPAAHGTANASVISVVTTDIPTVRTSTSRKCWSSITAEYWLVPKAPSSRRKES